jgi:hypothetical protein
MTPLLIALLVLIALVGLIWLGLELNYRRRPNNHLEVIQGEWDLTPQPHAYVLTGDIGFSNPSRNMEVMIPELTAHLTLLSQGSLAGVEHAITITPQHYDFPAREDGYWFAYIVKTCKQTHVQIQVEITGPEQALNQLQLAWLQVRYVTYGPKGRIPRVHNEVIPLAFPGPQDVFNWRTVGSSEVMPIRTHLLTPLDNPVEMVKRYVAPHAKPGDVVTIGETPVAIMQGRWHYPENIQPGWVARRVCQFFLPTSSLATACGMQVLVDIVGPTRILFAWLGGVLGKLVGQSGMFYRLAGEQARLIDDVTGTLPPYDQFIVLGPDQPQKVVDQIQRETGLGAAIVDVNDLGAVKILALSQGLSSQIVTEALRSNPAGNGDEQTPVVLIRPTQTAPARTPA